MGANVYLFFNGNCEEAMNFYKAGTDGSIESLVRYADTQVPCSDEWKQRIMHGVIHLNDSVIMCSDADEKNAVQSGNNFCISLDYKDETRMRSEFANLSAGGTVTMPLQDTFWGAVFGMCTDKFGIGWMFNHHRPNP
jgi:PhnB protein